MGCLRWSIDRSGIDVAAAGFALIKEMHSDTGTGSDRRYECREGAAVGRQALDHAHSAGGHLTACRCSLGKRMRAVDLEFCVEIRPANLPLEPKPPPSLCLRGG